MEEAGQVSRCSQYLEPFPGGRRCCLETTQTCVRQAASGTQKTARSFVSSDTSPCFTHRRRKLQVLDLRNVHHDFWDVWVGPEDGGRSAEAVCEEQTAKRLHRYVLRRRLKVVTDLCLRFHLNEHQAYLLQWAQQRRSSIRLCCVKMQIWALPAYTVRKVLMVFQPDSIQELELNTGWSLSTLVHFASYLDQMRNLQKLLITRIHKNTFKVLNTSSDIQKCITKFVSQFSKLNSLQHLSMNGIYFSSEHMKQLFR